LKKRKILAGILTVAMLISFTACATTNDDNNGNVDDGNSNDVIKIQVGYENNEAEPTAIAVKKWAEIVSEKSEGTIELELFPNSSLGTKTELIDQMLIGSPVITVADGAYLADYGVADFGILYAPYLFESWDEVWTVLDSEWYEQISDELADEAGLRVVGSNWIYGERNFLTTKPVVEPEDLDGLKIRVSANDLAIKSFENLGLAPVAMEMGDVYTSLQAGTIDGVENPIVSLANRSFHEVGKHLVKNNHIFATQIWITGEDFYSTLTDEQQSIIEEAAHEAGLHNNELYEDATEEAEQKMVDAGVTITELTEDQFAEWVNVASEFFDKGAEFGWSENLYETIRSIVE